MAIHPKMEAMERLLREMILNGEYNNCPYVYHPGVIKTLNGALQVNLRVWGNDTVEKHMTIKMPYNETFNDTVMNIRMEPLQYAIMIPRECGMVHRSLSLSLMIEKTLHVL